jgi:hypothetical protein
MEHSPDVETALQVMLKNLRIIIGPDFRADRICFAHAAPGDLSPYRRLALTSYLALLRENSSDDLLTQLDYMIQRQLRSGPCKSTRLHSVWAIVTRPPSGRPLRSGSARRQANIGNKHAVQRSHWLMAPSSCKDYIGVEYVNFVGCILGFRQHAFVKVTTPRTPDRYKPVYRYSCRDLPDHP